MHFSPPNIKKNRDRLIATFGSRMGYEPEGSLDCQVIKYEPEPEDSLTSYSLF